MKTKLEKFKVCSQCYCVGIIHTDCICSYGKYKSIELEFEVCVCCDNLIEDGVPADSEFNKQKLNEFL
jgi:hypothetical protein